MADMCSDRVFISYSRKQGSEFASRLRAQLLKEDLSVWQDIVAMEGGRDAWSQIEETLKSKALEHFVLVVTPDAMMRPIIRDEIRLARQEGKTVSPVRGPGLTDLNALPRWLGHIYDLGIPEQNARFMSVLQGPSRRTRVVMLAPPPPHDYVDRPLEFGALKEQLLDTKGDSVAITAALRGAGGYGKTTLATALAYDQDIRDAYFDGILWVQLAYSPRDLVSIISDIIQALSGVRPGFSEIEAAGPALGEALGDRHILMVIDDAWREQDIRPFVSWGGRNTTRLITTRSNDVLRELPAQIFRQQVDAMSGDEARTLLSLRLPSDQVRSQSAAIRALAGRLKEWAQLLRLVNGFLRERVIDGGDTLLQAIADADQQLTKRGLIAFDADNEEDRTRAIASTIELSLSQLNEKQRACFAELGVFPEDSDISIGVVAQLWRELAGFNENETKSLLSKLNGLSLLLRLNLKERTFRFHDTIRQFLHDRAGQSALTGQHQRLVEALDRIERSKEDAGVSDPTDGVPEHYYYEYLPHHLAEAGERQRLDALLLDPIWLEKKLSIIRNPQRLVADYERYSAGDTRRLIGRTLRLIVGIVARDRHQLIPQLLSRLMGSGSSDVSGFLEAARRRLVTPAILSQLRSLSSPTAEITRFEEHSGGVNALCMLPDGRLASGSDDCTIRLWDLQTGSESTSLRGHSGAVSALCMLPDGRLASGSHDSTIRLWDAQNGVESARLDVPAEWIRVLCALPDGRLATTSMEDIVLWDLKTGAESSRFEGHASHIFALCMLPDGRLASGSYDNTIRLWDLQFGAELACLEGHSSWIESLCMLADGRLASGSRDRTIRLWDLNVGLEVACLEGHTGLVTALCVLPDGRLASGSRDLTVRLWDVRVGVETTRLDGNFSEVTALCPLPDKRLASASVDRTIRLWDVHTAPETGTVERHSNRVMALCLLADGRLASGSMDNTIRLWDVQTGLKVDVFEGHTSGVTALCLLPDGRLASGSTNQTILMWDVEAGTVSQGLQGTWGEVSALYLLPDGRVVSAWEDDMIWLTDMRTGSSTALVGQPGGVAAFCMLPDGRLASSSYNDVTIRLWDVQTGTESSRLDVKSSPVDALCMLSDGRLASSSRDNTIFLWDVKAGVATARLEGHSKRIRALCALPHGRLASCSWDNTIRLWDVKADTAREIARLEIDAPVEGLIVLPDGRLVAGDGQGYLHWLEVVE
ncbi:NB-ARC domain-containing protein [Rhizobium laguerreae]|uniref:NB-ARC domain-containing protein n=1 Tax=Rhizobium laguerreae TaxID=1076926 RepID=UPI001C92566D|nr:NB-ARC domain-containing protein [Rhizobium laguerreae]MBY3252152.1 TIR domain-containing protein [Rhizobium laguerreae]